VAAEKSASIDPGEQHPQVVDTLIDELISEILNSTDAGQPAKSGVRGRSPSSASLFDTVRSTMAGAGSGTPLLERLLLAEALAGVLADAIAPALADALVPRIMKAIEQPNGAAESPPPTARPHPSERTRKTNAK
jgi:hypothetical protein